MKLVKKLTRAVLIILVIAVGIVSFIGYKGYQDYKTYSESVPISTLVDKVRSSENYVSYEELPDYLVQATVSAEDKRFFTHDGIDMLSLARAIASQFFSSLATSGGSTITQQVAKNLYGQYSTNVRWKLMEFFFAKELEELYTKEEIFAIYVNIINYGNNNTGIYEASMDYFGVYPSELSLGQCSLLAGIPQSPANYELLYHYDNAKVRQQYVLNCMVTNNYISQEEADEAYNNS